VVVSAFILTFMPETMNKAIPQTVEEMEAQAKEARENRGRRWFCCC